MKLRERLRALDRMQRSKRYKLIATAVIVVIAAAAAIAALYLQQQFTGGELEEAVRTQQEAREALVDSADISDEERVARRDAWFAAAQRASELRLERTEQGVLVGPGVLNWALPGIAAAAVIAVASVWLGLSLSYLAVLAVGGIAAGLIYVVPAVRPIGVFVLAALPLIVALLTLLELARLAMSPSHPVTAVARNVLNEAVRMKIGVVFIAFLILLLSLTPLVLEADQPLRFRVQQWLQYGAGLGFGVLLLLTAFFSCATVAFEQRDRRVWLTATKPVAAWHYVLGKWVGVMALNLVLLSVIASSVFIFTQYLRFQPAEGEVEAFVTEQGFDSRDIPAFMTDDRRKLENEVLVARVGVDPNPPQIREEALRSRAEAILNAQLRNDASVERTPELEQQALQTAQQELAQLYYAIPRGQARQYVFEGLERFLDAPASTTLNLRYRVLAGSNDPQAIYRVGFRFNNVPWPPVEQGRGGATQQAGVRQIGLDSVQLIGFTPGLISEEGVLVVEIYNFPANPREITLETDDFEVVYPVGGYELNFARAMVVLWVKLGFIAAVAMCCSTFLGFPTAVLVTLGVVFAAESAGFLSQSLEWYSSITREGEVRYDKLIARNMTRPVVWLFESYAGLTPIERLTSGRLLSWGDLGIATAQIAGWSAAILAIATAVYRRRELAIYSGN